jgi:hypothetical protein
MLGQSSNTLFLITTNEPVSSFHEAVARPGRCASLVAFDPLPAPEASAWLRAKEADAADGLTRAATLAELYATLAGQPVPIGPRPAIGFAPMRQVS